MTRTELYERIYAVTALIPPGKVLTYGRLAFLAGIINGGRIAGQAMSHAGAGRNLPCHRVVNSRGCCAPGFFEQQRLLQAEGVAFLQDGRVDLKHHVWQPEIE